MEHAKQKIFYFKPEVSEISALTKRIGTKIKQYNNTFFYLCRQTLY